MFLQGFEKYVSARYLENLMMSLKNFNVEFRCSVHVMYELCKVHAQFPITNIQKQQLEIGKQQQNDINEPLKYLLN